MFYGILIISTKWNHCWHYAEAWRACNCWHYAGYWGACHPHATLTSKSSVYIVTFSNLVYVIKFDKVISCIICAPSSEPDENIPETPLPAYSPSSSTTGQATIATSDIDTTTSIPLDATQPSPPEIYTFNNMYQEPCAKFSVGTLGRSSKKGENNGSNSGGNNGNSNGGNGGNNGNNPHVARIAPIQRNSEQHQQRFGDSLKRNITHNI